jgi:hypothetical protein
MQIAKDAEIGRRRADKLIQVWLADGKETLTATTISDVFGN